VSKIYTLLCVRADGTRPTLDVVSAGSEAELRTLALQTLDRHDSCDRVEVWDEDRLLFTITGADRLEAQA
jgi:hypothetical protein